MNKQKLYSIILLFLSFQISFGQNDIKKQNLKSNPESLKLISYNIVENFGNIKKLGITHGFNFTYNKSGFVVTQKNYGAKGLPIDQASIEYDSLNLVKEKSIKNKEGKLINRISFEYSDLKKTTYKSIYGFDGTLIGRFTYSYTKKRNNLSKVISFDRNGEKIEVKDYSYRKRKKTMKVETSNPKNKIVNNTKIFDENNNMLENQFFDVLGDLKSKVEFMYEDNLLVKTMFYEKDKLQIQKVLSYNDLGFLVKEIVQTFSSNKTDIITYTYDFDEKLNWVRKKRYVNSVPLIMEERVINYY